MVQRGRLVANRTAPSMTCVRCDARSLSMQVWLGLTDRQFSISKAIPSLQTSHLGSRNCIQIVRSALHQSMNLDCSCAAGSPPEYWSLLCIERFSPEFEMHLLCALQNQGKACAMEATISTKKKRHRRRHVSDQST